MDLQEVTNSLSSFGLEDLRIINRKVVDEINTQNKIRQFSLSMEFKVGDTVTWKNGKSGNVMAGKIVKCNLKTASVMIGINQRWTVPWSLLSKVN